MFIPGFILVIIVKRMDPLNVLNNFYGNINKKYFYMQKIINLLKIL